MKVSKIIEHLKEYHNPDDHLMIGWLEHGEVGIYLQEKIWVKACQLSDQATESLMDENYCTSFIKDAKRAIYDSYADV